MLRPQELKMVLSRRCQPNFPLTPGSLTEIIYQKMKDRISFQPYYKRLTGDDEQVKLQSAKCWSIWEGSTSRLITDHNLIDKTADGHFVKYLLLELNVTTLLTKVFLIQISWILKMLIK